MIKVDLKFKLPNLEDVCERSSHDLFLNKKIFKI